MKRLSLITLLFVSSISIAGINPYEETRYCGPPKRYANGDIKRSSVVLKRFQAIHPCPSTGLQAGKCPGWAMNHVVPLACGGCDEVSNLQWLPDDIKSCDGDHCVDRFERKINAAIPPYADTANCVNEVVP